MKKKLRLKTFRKNIIQLVIFLGIVTFLSSSQKYIPYTRQEIIVQDIVQMCIRDSAYDVRKDRREHRLHRS